MGLPLYIFILGIANALRDQVAHIAQILALWEIDHHLRVDLDRPVRALLHAPREHELPLLDVPRNLTQALKLLDHIRPVEVGVAPLDLHPHRPVAREAEVQAEQPAGGRVVDALLRPRLPFSEPAKPRRKGGLFQLLHSRKKLKSQRNFERYNILATTKVEKRHCTDTDSVER